VKFGGNDEFVTVVGVVGNVRHYALDEPAAPQMYMPQAQMTDSFLVLVVRTTTFDGLIGQIQAAVRALGPDVPVYNVRPMSVLVEQSAATRRFTATLLGLFAGVAGLMMAAGLYGLVAYMVTRRTREFGIRLALGAPKAGIRRLVIARGGLLTMTGAALGIAAALPLTRLLGDQLFETSATDANNLALGLAVLAITSAIAHLVPVARATRVSPTIALRGD
jgi:ABC-type antimicrobial peptide transport system permease subunit